MTQPEEIKSKLDIVDLIQEYTPLKQSGINLKGLCPFHNEKTPSFMVSREKQFFKCFGCGEGGDIFTFLQKIENLEFPEALKILAEKAGVKLIKQNYNPTFENLKTRLYDLHEIAVEFYQTQFNSPIGYPALSYLKTERGLPDNILKDFQIGYAPESWDVLSKFLKTKGFTDSEIMQSGLVVEKNNNAGGLNYYDRFRNRIMFPILDYHQNVVGFTARAMNKEESAKYINTPQTLIYNKSQVLYGLDKAKQAIRERGYVILVEGNMDVIASHIAGVKNVVASSGTSLTIDQLKILKRHTENLALCFDADSAGIKAAERGVDLIWAEGLNVKVIILPKSFKDPDELVKKNPTVWVEVSHKFINFMDYLLYLNLSQKNLSLIDAKKIVAGKILPWINKLTNPIDKEHYLKILANKINVTEATLKEVMQKNVLKTSTQSTMSAKSPTQAVQINKEKIMTERFLAIILGQGEYLIQAINKLLPEMLYKDYEEFYKELIFCYTKNNSFAIQEFENILKTADKKALIFVLESLKLFYETEFSVLTPKEINKEFTDAVNYLKKEKISKRLKEIEAELRIAERESQRELADSLMQEFSELSREINN
ncbi:MAG TPA: DNA primase [bacterium]|nr:DNA primase [bacterium]